jgi:bla regulator protein blaR1
MRTESRELLAVGVFGNKSRIGDRIEMLLRRGRTFSARASITGVATGVIVLSGLMLAGSLAPRWIAFAQEPRPTFEVASIKPNISASDTVELSAPVGGRFRAVNVSLRMLIMRAYKARNFEISGGPGWMNTGRFDIAAGAAGTGISEPQFKLMLRALLADRFKLTVHREMKQMPLYALVPLKSGLKLPAATGSCFEHDAPPPPTPMTPCGGFWLDAGQLEGRRISMAQFAGALSDLLGRPAIDKTGYAGTFDARLEFALEGIAPWSGGGFGAPTLSADAGHADSSKPTIFTAVQRQLGLKLESQKGPVEIIVVDHAEKPAEN